MKNKIIIAIVMIVTLGTLAVATQVECWDCTPSRCNFNLDCDMGCFCYKGRHQIDGVCVTK